eukprot:6001475-Prymnesium_polylepis.1
MLEHVVERGVKCVGGGGALVDLRAESVCHLGPHARAQPCLVVLLPRARALDGQLHLVQQAADALVHTREP